ncbi:SH3 domain-containing protein [Desulfogranum japonicum]|uniref:SH3 domain-containing protein n=1 Tax=Desulfogranum japonicum TaxID=231447 RepID=UPI0004907D96|nr:SH3 domain-containing protein [Desulfogranum japonicum]
MKAKSCCFFLIISLLFFLQVSIASAKMLSIKGDDINMRSGPGTQYKVLWQLGSGFPLKVLTQKGDWYRVQDFEGSVGWVHKMVTTSSPHMIVNVHKKTKRKINVRSGPGTNNRIVAQAYYGVVFKTLEQKNGWVHVEHEKGITGWIKRSLLWGY